MVPIFPKVAFPGVSQRIEGILTQPGLAHRLGLIQRAHDKNALRRHWQDRGIIAESFPPVPPRKDKVHTTVLARGERRRSSGIPVASHASRPGGCRWLCPAEEAWTGLVPLRAGKRWVGLVRLVWAILDLLEASRYVARFVWFSLGNCTKGHGDWGEDARDRSERSRNRAKIVSQRTKRDGGWLAPAGDP